MLTGHTQAGRKFYALIPRSYILANSNYSQLGETYEFFTT
jgi:hypothetical protein